jgi:hypothetical protein
MSCTAETAFRPKTAGRTTLCTAETVIQTKTAGRRAIRPYGHTTPEVSGGGDARSIQLRGRQPSGALDVTFWLSGGVSGWQGTGLHTYVGV